MVEFTYSKVGDYKYNELLQAYFPVIFQKREQLLLRARPDR